ncbi:hypothetical protein, partial [Burkholderia pseudomallei]|uniref:hypothetical protein n=1 Tax=Burkholderia pseudomallei TaxID=28450 RepID=UPI0021755517
MRLAHRIDRGDQIDVSVVLVTDKRMRAAAGIDQGQRGEETYVVSRPAACARRARENLSAFSWARRLMESHYPRACVNRSPNRIANWFMADFQSKAAR